MARAEDQMIQPDVDDSTDADDATDVDDRDDQHGERAGRPDGYGAVLTPEWWRLVERSDHPLDGSPVFRPAGGRRRRPDCAPIVLLHGVGNSGAIFGPILPTLARAAPVVAPTMTPQLLMAGEVSDDADPTDSVSALVTWLTAVQRPPWRLVGHSMGGVIAGLLMRIRPDLVERAVLLNAPLPGVTHRIRTHDTLDRTGRALIAMKALAQITALGRPRLPRFLRGPELLVVRNALRGFVRHPGGLDDRVISRAIMSSRTPDGVDFLRLGRELPDWEGAPFDVRPVDIVLGADDPLVPLSDLPAIHERYPAAELHVLDECGHFAHIERPQATLDLIEQAMCRSPGSSVSRRT